MLVSGSTVWNFRVLQCLGEGGLATVYRVRHLTLHSEHALKVLKQNNPGLRMRLLQEGRIQAGIRHPNVVAVTDVVDIDGHVGLVMELVDGSPLSDVLADEALPLGEALALFRQVLAGVRAAHAVGVLHRDIKPANILLAVDGLRVVAKILDFGVARCWGDAGLSGLTRAGALLGTPGYMAPEQALDATRADLRSDIFSLGAVLYEMISGVPPFLGRDTLEVLNATAQGRYVPLDERVPSCPPAVVAVVHRALSPDPNARYETCDEMARALTGVGADEGVPDVVTLAGRAPTPAARAPDSVSQRTLLPCDIPERTTVPPRPKPRPRRTIPPRPSRVRRALDVARRGAETGRRVLRWAGLPLLVLALACALIAGGAVGIAERTREAAIAARSTILASVDVHVAAAERLRALSPVPDRLGTAIQAVNEAASDTERVAATRELFGAMRRELEALRPTGGQAAFLERRAIVRELGRLEDQWRVYEAAIEAEDRAVRRPAIELATRLMR